MAEFFTPQKTKKDLWYKEPWMLLVLGGPVVVVIAAIVTVVIAWQGADKLVAKDYYKQGVNINKDIYRDARASEYKMRANVKLDHITGKVLLQLEGNTKFPSAVLFSASANSSASAYEQMQKVNLSQIQPGMYEGSLTIPAASDSISRTLWHVKIEAADWRLTADWQDPMHTSLQLKATN
jgi:uncharacterized protein